MAKFYGNVGFSKIIETSPGVYSQPETITRPYFGDVIELSNKWVQSENLNETYTVNAKISVIADTFFLANVGKVRYIEYLNSKWKVANISPVYPRLLLTLGGLYNGD